MSTEKSLEDELEKCQLVAKFQCSYCDYKTGSRSDLKHHVVNVHSKVAILKLAELEKKLFNQAENVTSSIHALMKTEISRLKKACVCKGYCVTNHLKHNW